MKQLSIGIDIGGTFTDIIIQDKASGENIKQIKVSTTPIKPEEAILNWLKNELSEDEKVIIQQIYHATTIATNAFLGQVNLELPQSALITTRGFRDVLEIGRQKRAVLYNLLFERPTPIIPRRYRFEITERINSEGEILRALKKEELKAISEQIKKEKIDSLAISLLHSYKNNIHEKAIKEYFETNHKDLYISTSFEVSPEHREYERTSTTTINALLMPLVSRYVQSLTESFKQLNITAPLFIMQSNGGVSRSDIIQLLPVSIIESGPSAGVVASRFLSEYLNLKKLLSFDMGGTTAKAGTVVDNMISLTNEYEVGGAVHCGRITKGSGYPARFPFIDLAEISSGGGSIAWVDQGNALMVGPKSAGSVPGPACYNQGGTNPTITDANLVLKRLNPKGLLNQTFTIYPTLALKSIKEKISSQLNLPEIESAIGIIKIANNNMSRILRIVTVERGLDPRDFTLLAFGGAGPLHACALATELEIKEILIPNSPGLFSAMGLLYTDAKHTFVKSIRKKTNEIDYQELEHQFLELEQCGEQVLREEGFTKNNSTHQRFIDARYVGQGFELLIPITGINFIEKQCKKKIEQLFTEKHYAIYGYQMFEEEVEIVNIRINSLGIIKKPMLRKIPEGTKTPPGNALIDSREVFFEEQGFIYTSIYVRNNLLAKNEIVGPAIIEQYDTTTLIPPDWMATIDSFGLIRIVRKD